MTTITTQTHTLTVAGLGEVELSFSERGQGRLFLLLHGGGGPLTVGGFADLLADREAAQVFVPVHPGFGGTPRPEALTSPAGLAAVYRELLEELDLQDVTVIGNSIGGWIAAELALLHSSRISSVILVDAIGIEVEGQPIADIFPLTPAQLSQLSYHDPARFGIDVSTMSDEQRAGMAANRGALAIYGGQPSIGDPTLAGRLAGVSLPTLVLWGESDQVVTPEYGRAFTAAIPDARFELLTATGHVPQIETPEQLLTPVWDFAARNATRRQAR